MHFTYIHNCWNTKQKENSNYMYHNYIWWQKELILFQIYLILAENDATKTVFKWYMYRIHVYFHNYFRCCWRPWWDYVFPCGSTLFINFPNKIVKNISEIGVSLCKLNRERLSWFIRRYIAIYVNSSKRENLSRGNTIFPSGNNMELSACSLTSHFSL